MLKGNGTVILVTTTKFETQTLRAGVLRFLFCLVSLKMNTSHAAFIIIFLVYWDMKTGVKKHQEYN